MGAATRILTFQITASRRTFPPVTRPATLPKSDGLSQQNPAHWLRQQTHILTLCCRCPNPLPPEWYFHAGLRGNKLVFSALVRLLLAEHRCLSPWCRCFPSAGSTDSSARWPGWRVCDRLLLRTALRSGITLLLLLNYWMQFYPTQYRRNFEVLPYVRRETDCPDPMGFVAPLLQAG